MGLPVSYYTASPQDISYRFVGTVVDYKGSPVLFVKAGAGGGNRSVTLYDFMKRDYIKTTLDDQDLSVRGLGHALGYWNPVPDVLAYLSRVPLNSRQQGLSHTNTVSQAYKEGTVFTLYKPHALAQSNLPSISSDLSVFGLNNNQQRDLINLADSLNMNYVFSFNTFNENFHRAYKGEYPDAMKVLDGSGKYTTAVSKHIALERDAFGDVYVVYKAERVGKMSKDRAKFLDSKAYLAQEVERNTGIMAI